MDTLCQCGSESSGMLLSVQQLDHWVWVEGLVINNGCRALGDQCELLEMWNNMKIHKLEPDCVTL